MGTSVMVTIFLGSFTHVSFGACPEDPEGIYFIIILSLPLKQNKIPKQVRNPRFSNLPSLPWENHTVTLLCEINYV